MKRRDFLVCSSAGLLTPLLSSATPDVPGGGQTPVRYAIGYWDRSEPEGLAGTGFLSPASLETGDAEFALSGARISIRGRMPSSLSGERAVPPLDSLEVLVDYRPYHENTFTAWRWDRRSAPQGGAPIRVTVPVHEECGVNLLVRTVRNSPSSDPEIREVPLRLSLGGGAADAKLRRGVYCVFLDEAELNQSEYRLEEKKQSLRLLRWKPAIGGWGTADTPYLTLSVDHARPEPVRVLA